MRTIPMISGDEQDVLDRRSRRLLYGSGDRKLVAKVKRGFNRRERASGRRQARQADES